MRKLKRNGRDLTSASSKTVTLKLVDGTEKIIPFSQFEKETQNIITVGKKFRPLGDFTIGDSVLIGDNVIIGKDVTIGSGTSIGNNVQIKDNITIGLACIIPDDFVLEEDLPDLTIIKPN